MQTSILTVNDDMDINLANVWYVDITWTAGDPTNVRLHFSGTDFVDLTGETARNYVRLRQLMPDVRKVQSNG
jgi:hypothetical protein